MEIEGYKGCFYRPGEVKAIGHPSPPYPAIFKNSSVIPLVG